MSTHSSPLLKKIKGGKGEFLLEKRDFLLRFGSN